MNKLLKKVIALGLSAALCLTGAGFAFADDGVKNEKDETNSNALYSFEEYCIITQKK